MRVPTAEIRPVDDARRRDGRGPDSSLKMLLIFIWTRVALETATQSPLDPDVLLITIAGQYQVNYVWVKAEEWPIELRAEAIAHGWKWT